MVWYGMVWYGMVWYGMVWYGMVWYGMVWYGMAWYGMAWHGMVWYGMVWYGTWAQVTMWGELPDDVDEFEPRERHPVAPTLVVLDREACHEGQAAMLAQQPALPEAEAPVDVLEGAHSAHVFPLFDWEARDDVGLALFVDDGPVDVIELVGEVLDEAHRIHRRHVCDRRVTQEARPLQPAAAPGLLLNSLHVDLVGAIVLDQVVNVHVVVVSTTRSPREVGVILSMLRAVPEPPRSDIV